MPGPMMRGPMRSNGMPVVKAKNAKKTTKKF